MGSRIGQSRRIPLLREGAGDISHRAASTYPYSAGQLGAVPTRGQSGFHLVNTELVIRIAAKQRVRNP